MNTRVAIGGLIALLSTQVATATAYENWLTLHDALLLEALDGAFEEADQRFERLIHDSPGDDPSRAASLYWLGRSQDLAGEEALARETLLDCVRRGNSRNACLQLLESIEARALAVRTLPTRWTFDDGAHGLSHPWRFRDKGSIKVSTRPDGDGVLRWTTQVGRDGDDQLQVLFNQHAPAHGLSFFASTTAFNMQLRVLVYDQEGRRYFSARAPVLEITPDHERRFTVDFQQLRAFGAGEQTINTREIHRVVLQDISSAVSENTGENTLIIDDFTVY